MRQDESAVRAVIDEVYAAWEANDVAAFVAPYAAEATATLPGRLLPSREAIRETMATLFAGPLAGSSARHEVQRVRFLGDDVAIALGESATVFAGASEPAPQTGARDTWVLSKRDERWRVQAFHSAPVDAA